MTKTSIFAALIAAGLLLACSKTEPQPNSANGTSQPGQASVDSAVQPVDYKMICERLIPLAPDARKATFSTTCLAEYQKLLPSCQNASAVNDCYAKMKGWDERLACMDSCVRK
jgi:hypothetical protein